MATLVILHVKYPLSYRIVS